MKNILMIHYELHFYRVPIYNKLSAELKKKGINLIIWPKEILSNKDKIEFDYIEKEFTINNYKTILNVNQINDVINFLQPSSPSYLFYLQIIAYTIARRINLYYYGHGLNLESNSKTLDFFYNILHGVYKKIILYTPNEKKYLWKVHHKKIEIAYNTLDLEERSCIIKEEKNAIRLKYGFTALDFIILFSGRIENRKKLDILIDIMNKLQIDNIKLLVVGPSKDQKICKEMNSNKNITYLGPVYDIEKMAEIFTISDIFSIPGHIGLGLVEALYWGLPVLTLDVKHAPEIFYLEHEYNGFILKNKIDLYNKIILLANDKNLMSYLSNNASDSFKNNAQLSNMIKGFTNALEEKNAK